MAEPKRAAPAPKKGAASLPAKLLDKGIKAPTKWVEKVMVREVQIKPVPMQKTSTMRGGIKKQLSPPKPKPTTKSVSRAKRV